MSESRVGWGAWSWLVFRSWSLNLGCHELHRDTMSSLISTSTLHAFAYCSSCNRNHRNHPWLKLKSDRNHPCLTPRSDRNHPYMTVWSWQRTRIYIRCDNRQNYLCVSISLIAAFASWRHCQQFLFNQLYIYERTLIRVWVVWDLYLLLLLDVFANTWRLAQLPSGRESHRLPRLQNIPEVWQLITHLIRGTRLNPIDIVRCRKAITDDTHLREA